MKFLFFVVAILMLINLEAQNMTLKGKVYDASNNEPLSFASIYFNSTTNGTISDENGEFSIPFNPNFTELIVSFLGYDPISHQVEIDQANRIHSFYLSPSEQILETVKIKSKRDKAWYHNLNLFKSQFIGTSKNAEKTKILNEESIYFSYDKKTKILKAFSREPLKIDNDALGYNIKYDLVEFTYDVKNGTCLFLGYPQYENKDEEPKKKWLKARKKAYLGSFLHFSQAMVAGISESEGFEVRNLVRKENRKERLNDEVNFNTATIRISPEINSNQNADMLEGKTFDPFQKLNREEEIYTLELSNLWQITYTKEKPDKNYHPNALKRRSRSSGKIQTSVLHLMDEKAEFNSAGIIIDPLDVLVEGYWSHEKLADMVPLDYNL
jgi:hypothetical protein